MKSKLNPALLFDTHVHFFDRRFAAPGQPDWRVLVKNAQQAGVGYFLNVGTSLATSTTAIKQAQEFDCIWAAVGVHPTDINLLTDQTEPELRKLLTHPKAIAIGEIGLDYFHKFTTKEEQQTGLHRQLRLAVEYKLPVLLHIRDAYADTYSIVAQYPVKGIVHCFSGTLADAQKFIELGFLISFSGTVTFLNSKKLQQIAAQIPLDKIVVETDAPYLSPHPYRGQINLPERIKLTVQKIAEIHHVSEQEVIRHLTPNTQNLFKFNTRDRIHRQNHQNKPH